MALGDEVTAPSVIARLGELLDRLDPGGVRGLYVYGSSAVGGLRPDSDIDLLLVTERSLGTAEREQLVTLLLQFSGRRATVTPSRPVELTCVVRDDLVPWGYPPRCDFLYGEWLRDEIGGGALPRPHVSPDLAVLLTTLQDHAQVLRGPDPGDLQEPVPAEDLRQAMRDGLAPLLDDLVGDERNVLLTLARMLVTLETGQILPKDRAGRAILPRLGDTDREVLARAICGYLGEVDDDWSHSADRAGATAVDLAARIRAALG